MWSVTPGSPAPGLGSASKLGMLDLYVRLTHLAFFVTVLDGNGPGPAQDQAEIALAKLVLPKLAGQ